MRTLSLLVGNATTRHHSERSMHSVRLVVDGTPRGRQVMTMAEAKTLAMILSKGCQAAGIDFTTSFPAVPTHPTLGA